MNNTVTKTTSNINAVLDAATYLEIASKHKSVTVDTCDISKLAVSYSELYKTSRTITTEILSHCLELDEHHNAIISLPQISVPSYIMLVMRDFRMVYEPMLNKLTKLNIRFVYIALNDNLYLYDIVGNNYLPLDI